MDCIGLRGAMAFALALQSVHDLPEGHGQTIFTATTAIVVLTVIHPSLETNNLLYTWAYRSNGSVANRWAKLFCILCDPSETYIRSC